jgi:hypothetical protein
MSEKRPAKRPAFQFYFRDWLTDPALRSCSMEARGLWIDCLAIMAEALPYGHLAVNGKEILPSVLARRVGEPLTAVKRRLLELEQHAVFSRTEDGIIFSRRMLRDEHNRQVRAAGGAKSQDNPNVPRKKDRGEGYPSDDPHAYPSGDPPTPSFVPSPAVASAVAVAKRQLPDSGFAFMGPFRDEWQESYGGEIPKGSARILKSLIAKHGEAETLRRFRIYLQATPGQYANVSRFASTVGTWKESDHAGRNTVLSRAEALHDLYYKFRFNQNLQMEDHRRTVERLASEGTIPDADAFYAQLVTVKPWVLLRGATEFDRAKHIATIAKLIGSSDQAAA